MLESAADVARRAKVALVHETHRGRSLHSAWATARLLRRAGESRVCFLRAACCSLSFELPNRNYWVRKVLRAILYA